MADAKKCDICGTLYELDGSEQEYSIHKKGAEKPLDLCPGCFERLGALVSGVKRSKRPKKYKIDTAGRDKMSAAASKRIKKAQKYREEHPDCSWGEALSASSNKNVVEKPPKKKLGRPKIKPDTKCWKYAKGKNPGDEIKEPADEF
jgi:hypothetical protein